MARTLLEVLKQNNQLDTLLCLNKTINEDSSSHLAVIKAVMEAGILVEAAMECAAQEQMRELRELLGPPLCDQFADEADDSKPTHVLCNGEVVRVN